MPRGTDSTNRRPSCTPEQRRPSWPWTRGTGHTTGAAARRRSARCRSRARPSCPTHRATGVTPCGRCPRARSGTTPPGRSPPPLSAAHMRSESASSGCGPSSSLSRGPCPNRLWPDSTNSGCPIGCTSPRAARRPGTCPSVPRWPRASPRAPAPCKRGGRLRPGRGSSAPSTSARRRGGPSSRTSSTCSPRRSWTSRPSRSCRPRLCSRTLSGRRSSATPMSCPRSHSPSRQSRPTPGGRQWRCPGPEGRAGPGCSSKWTCRP
mmetsp:Transcript_67008/g.187317  ORF Transcript_67008/g.187317 Transcript_67008/m.187317 type:complete len:263 (-) Transcript_67008:2230-3018(-)